MAKILVAMSGGIDSSVVAYFLKKKGHFVEGVYMKLHGNEEYHKQNIEKVRKVAEFLGIKFHILDLGKKFDKEVYEPFVQTYKEGLTPNPCVLCNRTIKLGALVDFAKKLGMQRLATGHYANVKDGFIAEALDKNKDQSYFLANVKKENISFVMFPSGDMYKDDIKKFASKIEVLKEFTYQKESSEICFVDTTYIDVLKKHIATDMPGDVLNTKGEKIGRHRGYMHYTIGKRRGFEVKGAHKPHYVIKIDAKKNQIIVGSKEELDVENFNIKDINMLIPNIEFECFVKIRYGSPKIPCFVKIKKNSATVTLYEKVQGLAPGQAAVFYKDDKVIGCGWIV